MNNLVRCMTYLDESLHTLMRARVDAREPATFGEIIGSLYGETHAAYDAWEAARPHRLTADTPM